MKPVAIFVVVLLMALAALASSRDHKRLSAIRRAEMDFQIAYSADDMIGMRASLRRQGELFCGSWMLNFQERDWACRLAKEYVK